MDALAPLLVALLIGFLIGLDRERAEERKEHALFAGVRTFPLIALAGAVTMLMHDVAGPGPLLVCFVAVAAVALLSYWRTLQLGHAGATTEIAALVTFLLGALAGMGQLTLAAAAGVAVAVLLAAKPPLEAFSRALTAEELFAVLQLAVISVIVLPVLPDRGYGPWEVLNPREIWTVVVLVSTLSFAGFVAIRLLGEGRGMVMTGAIGGLVSSTAVTLAMAEHSRTGTAAARPAATAVVLASAIMCARIAVLAAAINARILPRLLPGLGAMALAGAVAAWLLLRGDQRSSARAGPKVRNPFRLADALTFAAIYAAVVLIARAAHEYLGERGMYATAVVSGLADVDAPTIAFTRLGATGGWRTPAAAVMVAAVSNTVVKAGLAIVLGRGRFRGAVAAALGSMALVGLLTAGVIFAAG